MSVRVGYFPQNNSLFVLRHLGILDKRLPDVEWVDLRGLDHGPRVDPTSALPSAHGDHLFDGGYDFIGTGSTPPVTAQAKGHDIVYVAVSGPRVENGRLVVPADSDVQDPAGLRGKRVALGHGSWQTTLLLLALDKAGLTWSDIVPVDSYGDAAERFLAREVDAWVGSYPDLTKVEQQARIRELIPTEGLFSHRSLWFTSRAFAAGRRPELAAIIEALHEADAWTAANPARAAEFFAADDSRPAAEWEHALRTRPWGLLPVDSDFVGEQQHAADLFYANGLIQQRVSVADAVSEEVNAITRALPR
ncbi:ABC transporter substrate-binding protein [Catenulispora sp. NF23]|uniref:ABC transporter substrate-binding protein n=1 Tax=Catenulispora pinistramenti TaxID=2705254 RepID=UPI001BAC0E13|nr:ABC transporter substrate-binding protein [Catenulispora pinistramenti]MBS2535781.1 ABC transporter substrate-binding protein [Catenulispora pinistramenti]